MDDSAWVEQHQGLVVKIAHDVAQRYRLRRFMDDLVGFGHEGLLEARNRYDDTQKTAFSTYAWYIIKGRILDGCRSMGLVARRRETRSQLEVERAFAEHQCVSLEDDPAEPNQTADLADIAADLDDMVGDAAAIFLLQDETESEQQPDTAPDPEQRAERASTASWVRQQLDTLEPDDRNVLEMSFFQGKTLDDIADEYGCSRSWASRMRSAALKRLRYRIARDEVSL